MLAKSQLLLVLLWVILCFTHILCVLNHVCVRAVLSSVVGSKIENKFRHETATASAICRKTWSRPPQFSDYHYYHRRHWPELMCRLFSLFRSVTHFIWHFCFYFYLIFFLKWIIDLDIYSTATCYETRFIVSSICPSCIVVVCPLWNHDLWLTTNRRQPTVVHH